ncbi:MAG: hypothetical protein UF228_10385 [Lachnospiraceae bacterium]|nr:hypothetical protein [Lachnospiraceae bacterium]
MFGDKSDGIAQGLGQVGGMLLTGGLGNAAGLGMAEHLPLRLELHF